MSLPPLPELDGNLVWWDQQSISHKHVGAYRVSTTQSYAKLAVREALENAIERINLRHGFATMTLSQVADTIRALMKEYE